MGTGCKTLRRAGAYSIFVIGGINGNITVYGPTGAVLPPLEEDPPVEDPTDSDPPLPTEAFEITPNGVLTGRGTVTGSEIVIPYGVIHIEEFAFSNDNLTNVTIPNGVQSIGDGAFLSNNLTSVVLPDSVRTIGLNAFSINPVTTITIGDDVSILTSFEGATAMGNYGSAFLGYYNAAPPGNNGQGGTFVWNGTNWSRQP